MLLVKNGYIKTMVGEDIENGSILIGEDGRLAAIGEDIEAPAEAEIIDAHGCLVTPGIVEAHCHNGRILAIGRDIDAEGAEVIDADGRLVTPGLVEAHCHIGLRMSSIG